MSQVKYIIIIAVLFLANCATFAQKTERDYIRKGNKLYTDSSYVQAEVNYRKALELNPNSTEALYNLGNTLSHQGKLKDAMEKYTAATKAAGKNNTKLAKIYHNAGVLYQSAKHYQEAVQSYKQSLRYNPSDDETRYNLALAMKMLKDQQKKQQNKDKNKDKNKNKDKDKQKKDDQKKKQDQKNKDDKQKQQPKPQPDKNKMSKQNAEQLLNAAMQDEKQLQEKAKKQLRNQGRNLDKDW
ncbi:tetratricopeptide repeat protein [uncultured Bacteroides sp.]|uniref:tetratricopeptide repeat protein n=1 Tax=uncultured Bacteroides sp. TaxID=162156 RepID=UPI002AABA785|nr:tetratricopeptide repeat protein [uncultured Bacteroides sp.]